MPDTHRTPLLKSQVSEQEVPEDLEEGLDRGPLHDFQHLIDAQPEAVIRYAAASKNFAVAIHSGIS